jgi:metalloendopeptidase OMA1, mitochondrial
MCCTSRYIVAYRSSDLVIHGPCRMEIEADHIGLLLLGAAGYDPRVAPSVYEKLGNIGEDSALNNYLSTHPSSKKRAQLLSQAHVMNEALELYREVSAGQGSKGFL